MKTKEQKLAALQAEIRYWEARKDFIEAVIADLEQEKEELTQ